jgi:hypothetical protein
LGVEREEGVVGEDGEGPEGWSLKVDPHQHERSERHFESDPAEEQRSDPFAERKEKSAS